MQAKPPEVTVLYFAGLREVTRTAQEVWLLRQIVDGSVGGVVDQVVRRHPGLRPHLPSLRYAVNESFVDEQTPIQAGDVVALIPPVSGG